MVKKIIFFALLSFLVLYLLFFRKGTKSVSIDKFAQCLYENVLESPEAREVFGIEDEKGKFV